MSKSVDWPIGQVLPRFGEPKKKLDTVDVRKEPYDVKVMMAVLQGLVNREEPHLMIYEKPWKKENWAQELGLDAALPVDYLEIVEKYQSYVKGLIIYDAKVIDTVNLATTMAGFEDALVVSERLAAILTQAPYSLKVIEDMNGKFKDKFEVYDYSLEQIWPKCTHRLIIGLDAKEEQHTAYIRDLAVAGRITVFWLDPREEKEQEYIKKYFKDTVPVETYYAGWWPEEGAGIRIGSEHGIPTVPADYFENYTVYSGMKQEFDVPPIPKKPELETKFYVAFMVSDGDNIQYCEHAMKTDDILWPSPERGQFPISWTAAPTLADAAPQMLNYYYKTATENDLIISGPSGAGYTDPQRWQNNQDLAKYCKVTNDYFRKTGFNFIAAWNFIRDDQDHVYEENCPALTGLSIQERFENQATFKIIKDEMPLLTAKPRYDGDEPRVLRILTEDIEKWDGKAPMFYCPQCVSWEMGVPGINRVYRALKEKFGDKVEFVRADHLAMLFREAHNCPYCVSLQAPATASATDGAEGEITYAAANVTNGSFSRKNGWKSSAAGEKWVCVDLEGTYKISRYVLMNAECAYYEKALNTKDFKIQGSMDGNTWTDMDVVSGNTEAYLDKKITPVTARYVRVYITDPGADGAARIQQFEVHGVKA